MACARLAGSIISEPVLARRLRLAGVARAALGSPPRWECGDGAAASDACPAPFAWSATATLPLPALSGWLTASPVGGEASDVLASPEASGWARCGSLWGSSSDSGSVPARCARSSNTARTSREKTRCGSSNRLLTADITRRSGCCMSTTMPRSVLDGGVWVCGVGLRTAIGSHEWSVAQQTSPCRVQHPTCWY